MNFPQEFKKHCHEWKKQIRRNYFPAVAQNRLAAIGTQRFTVDDHYYKKVIEALKNFIKKE
jgi:hypothetical protein